MFKHIVQVLGFVATCIGLYTWFTAPTAGLEADVYFADFELPPSIAQQFRALAPLASPPEARAMFFKPSVRSRISLDPSGAVDQIFSNMANLANDKAPILKRGADFAYKGYWRVAVKNTGSKAASAVSLHLPFLAAGVTSRSREKPVQDLPVETTRVFALGNIQHGDELVVVYAWSISPATDEAAQKITLTHDVGTGRVRIAR